MLPPVSANIKDDMHTELRHASIAETEVRDDEYEDNDTPEKVERQAEDEDEDQGLEYNETLMEVFHNMLYVYEPDTYATAGEKKRHTEEETINAFINQFGAEHQKAAREMAEKYIALDKIKMEEA